MKKEQIEKMVMDYFFGTLTIGELMVEIASPEKLKTMITTGTTENHQALKDENERTKTKTKKLLTDIMQTGPNNLMDKYAKAMEVNTGRDDFGVSRAVLIKAFTMDGEKIHDVSAGSIEQAFRIIKKMVNVLDMDISIWELRPHEVIMMDFIGEHIEGRGRIIIELY